MNQPRSTNAILGGNLLTHYQPKILTTEAENEEALSLIEFLANKSDLTPEEDRLL